MTLQAQLNQHSINQTETIKEVIAQAEPDNRNKMQDICIKAMLDSSTPFDQMDSEEKEIFERSVLTQFLDSYLIKTKIIECEMNERAIDGSVLVTAMGADDKTEETFNVQLLGCAHRSSLGCWVTTDGDDISDYDYPLFNLKIIINAAEDHAKKSLNPTFYKGFWIVDVLGGVEVWERNEHYLNKDASPYTKDWEDMLGKFDDEEEAKSWIDSDKDADNE